MYFFWRSKKEQDSTAFSELISVDVDFDFVLLKKRQPTVVEKVDILSEKMTIIVKHFAYMSGNSG